MECRSLAETMGYREFTEELKSAFLKLLPDYIGVAHKRIGTKIKNDGTPITDLDNTSLARLRELFVKHFPDDLIIGEEDKRSEEEIREILTRETEYQLTADGLDGTGNYRMGTSSYGASISRRHGHRILYAAEFRPIEQILRGNGFFFAVRGYGAWQWCEEHKTYHRLQTAREGELERVVVMLEGSSKKFFKPPISKLGKTTTTRPSFSSCIAATTVAMGKASALVTADNKPWDNWPSILMIEEAGGIVTDWQGNRITPDNCGNIVAAGNTVDHARIIEILNK